MSPTADYVAPLPYVRPMTSIDSRMDRLITAELRLRIATLGSMSQWERAELGRELRRAGLSYGEIGDVIPAAKATIAGWCRDIELTNEQAAAIRDRTGGKSGVPVDTQRKRRVEVERIRRAATVEAGALSTDARWTAGVALYWAEGFKTERQLGMANSDEALLSFFMTWTRLYLDPAAEFRAKLNLHAGNDEAAARRHWAMALGLTTTDFSKTYIKPDGTGHRRNHLPHGVCQIRMRSSGDAFHRAMAWIGVMRRLSDSPRLLSCPPGR